MCPIPAVINTGSDDAASTLEHAREAFELATIARALAYAAEGPSSETAKVAAHAATKASDARRAYEKAILADAQVLDPGLSRLP